MKKTYVMGLAAIAAVTCLSTAQAMDTFMVGPRAMGMAGANVASVDNNSAQYYNPAAFGFFGRHNDDESKSVGDNNNLGRKNIGWDVYAGAGVDFKNDLGKYIDTLADIDINNLSSNGIQTESDLQDIVNLVTSLNGLDEPGNALMVDTNAGTSLRFKNFGIGLRGYSQVVGYVPLVDQDNLGLNLTGDLATEINSSVATTGIDYSGSATSFFTADQYNALLAALNGDADAADIVAYYADKQGVTQQQADELITTIGNINTQSGTTELNENTTTVVLNGFGIAEVPLTYGYALNDNIAIGANLKLMKGRVYGTEVLVFNDGSGDILEKTDENFQETTTFGVDLGVMARYSMFNFGLTGRNLNSPKFDGFSKSISYTLKDGTTYTPENPLIVPDVKLKPQAVAGLAFIPFETFTIEVDYDLTKNETVFKNSVTKEIYKTQNLSAGLEWDIYRVLALRAGAYKNMAESDTGVVYTAGLGLNLWAVRLDVAAAASPDKVQYDGKEVPKLAKASVQLSIDF